MHACAVTLRPLAVLAPLLGASLCAQVTESPQTVAPGKWLLETEALHVRVNRDQDEFPQTTALNLASSILSAGLTDVVDLQLGVTVFWREEVDAGGHRNTSSGAEHLDFRAKWKFWSDESRGWALAAIPYLKVPLNTGAVGHDSIEGGLIVPLSRQLSDKATAGAMFQWDLVRNEADSGYDSRMLLTVYAEHKVGANVSIYGEATGFASTAVSSDWAGSLGAGVLWQVTPSVQLDYELQRGVRDREVEWIHALRLNWAW